MKSTDNLPASAIIARRAVQCGLLTLALGLTACGGGGGGGGGEPSPDPGGAVGDDARRAVLADIGDDIILPALRDFDELSASLVTAAEASASDPADTALRDATRTAWDAAMTSWQRNEVLQVGPAGRSTNPDMVVGGQDFRDQIYIWPFTLNACAVEAAAEAGTAINAATNPNQVGLGALEHLLFTAAPPANCAAQPDAAARAEHVARLAERVAVVASTLRDRWEPDGGNFIAQWSTAGDGSTFYMRPQDALNAVSIALFYAEKNSKDRKIAYPSGLPAADLECPDVACPQFLESRLSRRSGRT